MKQTILFFLLLAVFASPVFGQTDQELINETIYKFIDGTTYSYPDKIEDAFYPNTRMFLHNGSDTAWTVTSEMYAALYRRGVPGKSNGRIGSITSIDIELDVAFAKVQFIIPSLGNRYYDLLLLKKIKGDWKIVAKCTSAEPIPKTPQETLARPTKEVVMEGLNHPWSVAFLSEEEAIIAEKDGDLVRVNLTTRSREVISGTPDDVARPVLIDTAKYQWGVFPPTAHGQTQRFNAGWFQVLLDPDFSANSYIYISYAAENKERASTTKVIRGKLSGNRLDNVETLFLAAPYSHGLFHYGGGMMFGSDKKLYITIGERIFYEHLNPLLPISQDVSDPRGKVIRINPDGSIPEDNPDFGPKAIRGLYAIGIRASQGLAIEPATNKIWFSEHGTMQGDELNILEEGANYGWPFQTTGGYRTKDYHPPVPAGTRFTEPTYSWLQTVAPTGITFYNGTAFPQWVGNLIVPGLSRGSLWRMSISDGKITSAEELFANDHVRIRKAVISPRGVLYVLTDEDNGKLIRIKNGE